MSLKEIQKGTPKLCLFLFPSFLFFFFPPRMHNLTVSEVLFWGTFGSSVSLSRRVDTWLGWEGRQSRKEGPCSWMSLLHSSRILEQHAAKAESEHSSSLSSLRYSRTWPSSRFWTAWSTTTGASYATSIVLGVARSVVFLSLHILKMII